MRLKSSFVACGIIVLSLSSGAAAQQMGIITVERANLRAAASIDASIVGTLKEGATVTIVEGTETWTKVTTGSLVGWVRTSMLAVRSGNQNTAESIPKTRTASSPSKSMQQPANVREDRPARSENGGRSRQGYGLGLSASYPAAYGVSGTYDFSESLTGQATIGAVEWGTYIGGRAIFKLKPPNEPWRTYAYVGAGYWTGYLNYGGAPVPAGGVGIELDLRKLSPTAPSLRINADIGLGMAFYSGGSWTFVSAGPAVHWIF